MSSVLAILLQTPTLAIRPIVRSFVSDHVSLSDTLTRSFLRFWKLHILGDIYIGLNSVCLVAAALPFLEGTKFRHSRNKLYNMTLFMLVGQPLWP